MEICDGGDLWIFFLRRRITFPIIGLAMSCPLPVPSLLFLYVRRTGLHVMARRDNGFLLRRTVSFPCSGMAPRTLRNPLSTVRHLMPRNSFQDEPQDMGEKTRVMSPAVNRCYERHAMS